jgi:prolipoprotein diacylglyceryl transferase
MSTLAAILPMAINWAPSPEIFSIGPIHIRYYSVLFVSGFIIGYYIFVKFFKREGLPVEILDMLLYTLLGSAVIGARLGHCLFYEPEYYLARPLEIFKVWEGGLASHGGAIAILISIWYYVKKYGRKYDFDYMWLLDRIAVATPLAGALIRLGNLMNSEIYGNPTDLPWGFVFLLRGETIATPISTNGILSHWPIFRVIPCSKATCGSFTNSMKKRAPKIPIKKRPNSVPLLSFGRALK